MSIQPYARRVAEALEYQKANFNIHLSYRERKWLEIYVKQLRIDWYNRDYGSVQHTVELINDLKNQS